jgi:hypothetical protein
MPQYHFYIKKAVQSESGWSLGNEVDLEEHFKGLRYKSCTGLRAYGVQKGIYTETYAESDKARVYVSPLSVYEQTDITLTLYFFDPLGRDVTNEESRQAAIKAAGEVYDNFVEYVSGGLVIYRDTARQRKVLMYLSDKSEPVTDTLKGIIYMEVPFKFKNVYGCTFSVSDTTIEDYLSGDE